MVFKFLRFGLQLKFRVGLDWGIAINRLGIECFFVLDKLQFLLESPSPIGTDDKSSCDSQRQDASVPPALGSVRDT